MVIQKMRFQLLIALAIACLPDILRLSESLFCPVAHSQSLPQLENLAEFRKSFEARYIPSGTMMPTLQIGDRLLIDKHTYQSQAPKRGDIVIFSPTKNLRKQNFKDAFIKRIVGLPGETIKVTNGKVYINNVALKESYITEPPEYQYDPAKIPTNAYFVLGDNRNNSYDSHYWGFVSRSLIFGKAIGIYCPIARQRILDIVQPLNPKNQAVLDQIQQWAREIPFFCNASSISKN